jgi:hypothetical protein
MRPPLLGELLNPDEAHGDPAPREVLADVTDEGGDLTSGPLDVRAIGQGEHGDLPPRTLLDMEPGRGENGALKPF